MPRSRSLPAEEAWARALAPLKETDGIRLVTRKKAAEMLGVSLSSIQRAREAGRPTRA